MADPSGVNELVLRWQELRAQGRAVSAEELCAGRPDLVDDLRRQLEALRSMEQFLGATGDGAPAVTPEAACGAERAAGLPAIAGYELLGELGRGGMGVVYQARQLRLKRLVALKMIVAGGRAGEPHLARLQTEAEAIARLQHPNIVQVYEVGAHEGQPFLALEYCGGGSLARKLQGTPLPARDAAALAEVLARAVQAAHDRHILHRDLKPANVLLAADGTAKIGDFGLAKKLDEAGQTHPGAILGTPSYMAPEQAAGRSGVIGPAADTYALGAILYECLTGRPPFKAATAVETVRQVLDEEPVSPRQVNAGVPRDLETVCLKCLRKEPGQRYASAAALAEDLRRFQAGEPILARPVGRWERGIKWVRRNPVLAGALAAVLVVFAAGATVSTVFGVLADRRAEEAAKARGQAEQEASNARTKQADAEAAKDQLLTTAARGLLRALAVHLDKWEPTFGDSSVVVLPLGDPEVDALWELASSPSEELRVRFVAEALRGRVSARQLKSRAAFALHAAVGLDPERQARVERLLGGRLRAEGVTVDEQRDVALVLAQGGVQDRRLAAQITTTLLQALKQTKNRGQLLDFGRGLSAVMGRLGTQDAALAAVALTRSIKDNKDPIIRRPLAEALSALAAPLGPQAAARVCRQAATTLTRAIQDNKDPTAWRALAEGLSALAPRLDPRDAATLAAAALTLALKDSGPELVRLVSALAARLDPKDAAKAAAAFTQVIKDNRNRNGLWYNVLSLSALAARLEAKDAAPLAATLTHAIKDNKDPNAWQALAEGLLALAARLGPQEAAGMCAQAAAALTHAIKDNKDPYAWHGLAKGLAALAARLEAKDAAPLAAALSRATQDSPSPNAWQALAEGLAALAARLEAEDAAPLAITLTQAIKDNKNRYSLWWLATGLAALAARLEAKDAAPLAATLTHAIKDNKDPTAWHALATGLAALAARLEAKDAAPLAAALSRAIRDNKDNKDPNAWEALAKGLLALVARLGPQEAAEASAAAAAVLRRAIRDNRNPYTWFVLAEGLSALATRLEPREAAGVSAAAAAALRQVIKGNERPRYNFPLGRQLSGLAVRLDPKDAAAAAAALAQALEDNKDVFPPNEWPAHVLSALAVRLEVKDAAKNASALISDKTVDVRRLDAELRLQALAALLSRDASRPTRTCSLAAAVALSSGAGTPLASLAVLPPALEPLPPPLPAQALVDLLKHPLCVGEARRLVLAQLARHYGRPFADQWEFVAYARQKNLGLDFVTPPKRFTGPARRQAE
jgi:hypothetical protein